MTRPLRRRPRHGVVGCLCSTGQPSAPSSPTSTSASGSHTTKSASFPGAMEPFEPRPATHAGRELHTSRGKMRCDRGKERSASRRVARENAFGGTSRGRKPNRRKYAEVCFKSPPRRRRRLPIDKSAWYVAGNKRSVDSAAYWWGIKPPYPTAPVPSRIWAEKTRQDAASQSRGFVLSSQMRAPFAHLPQPFPIFRLSDWRRTLEKRVSIRNLLRGEGEVVRARLCRDSPPRTSRLSNRLEAVSVRHVRHVDTPTGARCELRQHLDGILRVREA